jgi:sugar phosphate isomerase/epimerase
MFLKIKHMKNYYAHCFLICIFLLVSTILPAQKQKPLYTAPLGIEAYTFRVGFAMDPISTLDTIQRLGFTEMEGNSAGMPPSTFKTLCEARGIEFESLGVGYDQLIKAPDSVAALAKILGAKFVMCAWVPHKGSFNIDDAKKAVDDFNRVGRKLKENGLVFCYHAHGYEFQNYENGSLLDYIIKNTNPKWVSFEMDIFWIQFGGGNPVALLKQYGDRWKLMHLKDLRKGADKNPNGLTTPDNDVPLGTGELDIPAILKEARKIGIKHYFIEDESNDVNTQVPLSIQYLKSLKAE